MKYALPVHRLFVEQAARTPHAEAVSGGGIAVSYGELDRLSDEIGVRLQRAGVGPDVVVGVCSERSIEMIAGFLGVLKAGGGYLYLDPEFPRERIAFMCEDARVRVILASEVGNGAIDGAAFSRIPTLTLRGHLTATEARPRTSMDPSSLAYIVYTSGSTGQPKGVAIEHRALSQVARALVGAYDVRASDRVLQFASPSWDTMVEEIFPTLLAGATLVLRSRDMIETAALLRGCVSGRVTIANLPTAVWHRLIADLEQEEMDLPPSLRTVIVGGEPPALDRIAAWLERAGQQVRLLNTYGLTEAAAVSTFTHLRRATAPIPIGVPLPHVRVSIRDQHLTEQPDGEMGEICIHGEGVARGYVNRPELTAAKFVEDPERPGERFYRTGDSGFRGADGQFVCAGRLDDQIKVGGVRIEPREIEAVLRGHGSVAEAVVKAYERNGERRLIAYVVLHAGSQAALTPTDLRAFAGKRLPAAMVPEIVLLEDLPLTVSGKIDRQRLRPPASSTAAVDMKDAQPLEAALCALAGEILGAGVIAPDDDFFDRGGNSLHATSLLSRARRELGLEIAFEGLIAARTMRTVAARAEKATGDLPGIPRRSHADGPVLSLAQEWYWNDFQRNPKNTAYNLRWIVYIRGPLQPKVLERALEVLVARHEPLRTIFVGDGPDDDPERNPRTMVLSTPRVSLCRVTWRNASRPDIEAFAERDASHPFDLTYELPFRATLVEYGTSASPTFALVLCVHHIAIDGWSLGILAREAEIIYAALLRGEQPALPELPITYSDYAAWERGLAGSEALQKQLVYWRRQLRGASQAMALPFDRPRPKKRSLRGERIPISWPAKTWSALRALARAHGATPFMILLAMFAARLKAWTGEADLVIGTPIANRNRPEIEPLVGCFLNTLALRVDLAGNPSFAELVRRVCVVCLGAYANQDVPSDLIAEGPNPLYRVMLSFQTMAIDTPAIDGLTFEADDVDQAIGFHDLLLEVVEWSDGASLTWEYNCELFDRATVERLADDFNRYAMENLR